MKYLVNLKFTTLLLAVLLSTIPGCDDDKLSPNTTLLTSAPWKFNFVTHPDSTIQAFYSTFYVGFGVTFNVDGTYSGTIPADPSDPTFDGVWKFNETETEVILDEGTDETVLQIEELTEDSFIFMIPDEIQMLSISMRH